MEIYSFILRTAERKFSIIYCGVTESTQETARRKALSLAKNMKNFSHFILT